MVVNGWRVGSFSLSSLPSQPDGDCEGRISGRMVEGIVIRRGKKGIGDGVEVGQ